MDRIQRYDQPMKGEERRGEEKRGEERGSGEGEDIESEPIQPKTNPVLIPGKSKTSNRQTVHS